MFYTRTNFPLSVDLLGFIGFWRVTLWFNRIREIAKFIAMANSNWWSVCAIDFSMMFCSKITRGGCFLRSMTSLRLRNQALYYRKIPRSENFAYFANWAELIPSKESYGENIWRCKECSCMFEYEYLHKLWKCCGKTLFIWNIPKVVKCVYVCLWLWILKKWKFGLILMFQEDLLWIQGVHHKLNQVENQLGHGGAKKFWCSLI